MIPYDSDDQHSMALCLWREARGEGEAGIAAVAHVICNRVGHSGFAPTLHGVIFGKNQFSSMSRPSDPEYRLYPGDADSMWPRCIAAATEALNSGADPTLGACYYANLTTADKGGWFQQNIVNEPILHPFTIKIGRHSFYR